MEKENVTLEIGAASLLLEYRAGKLTAKHGQTGEIIYKADLPSGGWREILMVIIGATINGRGEWERLGKSLEQMKADGLI